MFKWTNLMQWMQTMTSQTGVNVQAASSPREVVCNRMITGLRDLDLNLLSSLTEGLWISHSTSQSLSLLICSMRATLFLPSK